MTLDIPLAVEQRAGLLSMDGISKWVNTSNDLAAATGGLRTRITMSEVRDAELFAFTLYRYLGR